MRMAFFAVKKNINNIWKKIPSYIIKKSKTICKNTILLYINNLRKYKVLSFIMKEMKVM